MIQKVSGGVCAAKGFKANGVHCGIRKNKTKKDLALIVSECRASAAAVYTTNLVKGAPIAVTKAQEFLNLALRHSYAPGKGFGPVNHMAGLKK